MFTKNPAFLGQVPIARLGQSQSAPQQPYQSYSNVRMTPTPFPPPGDGACPPGKMPFRFADRTVCVDSGHYPVGAAGSEPGMIRPPGTPQIQPPIETSLPAIDDIGPDFPPSVESRDDFYPYRTGQTPPLPGAEAAQGLPCPPDQYRPPGAGWCIPRPPVQTGAPGGFGSFGAFGAAINMGPSAPAFTMGRRAMLGQVRLVRRPF